MCGLIEFLCEIFDLVDMFEVFDLIGNVLFVLLDDLLWLYCLCILFVLGNCFIVFFCVFGVCE